MTLLVGTDLQPSSRQAAQVCAALARKLGQSMVLLHVLGGPFANRSLARSGRRGQQGLEMLETEAAALAGPGLEIGAELRSGPLPRVLARTAEELQASCLVLNADAPAATEPFWRTSKLERTVRRSTRPVLIMRKQDSLLSWATGRERLRILVATDLTPASVKALDWAVGWHSRGDCSLTLVRVVHPPDEHNRLGIPGPSDSLSPEAGVILLREMREKVSPLPEKTALRIVTGSGRVADALMDTVALENADLLVVASRRIANLRGGLEDSVSRRLVHLAPTNLVCVPVDKVPGPSAPARLSRLLVATDLTPEGNRAVDYACTLLPNGGILHLLHATDAGSASEACRRLAELVPSEAGLQVHLETPLSSDPAQAICQAAERLGVDALCLAMHQRYGLARVLGESISTQVLQQATVPVLLVPPTSPPGPAWLGMHRQG
jgi:nucleotide-binding universal stress UspA family protein